MHSLFGDLCQRSSFLFHNAGAKRRRERVGDNAPVGSALLYKPLREIATTKLTVPAFIS